MILAIDYKRATDEQLIAIKTGKDAHSAELAKHELDRRLDRRRFWRSFFFPNIWAVLSLVVAIYAALKK